MNIDNCDAEVQEPPTKKERIEKQQPEEHNGGGSVEEKKENHQTTNSSQQQLNNKEGTKGAEKVCAGTTDQEKKETIEKRFAWTSSKQSTKKLKTNQKVKKWFAVVIGRETGVFTSWRECSKHVHKFPHAKFKSFRTQHEADQYMSDYAANPDDCDIKYKKKTEEVDDFAEFQKNCPRIDTDPETIRALRPNQSLPVDRNWLQKLVTKHKKSSSSSSPPPPKFLKVLAPMVDQSDKPFRLLCQKYGTDLSFTPMIHCKLYCTSPHYRQKFSLKPKTKGSSSSSSSSSSQDRPLIAQICGSDLQHVVQCCLHLQQHCDGIDINCGCKYLFRYLKRNIESL